jgi:hypothetical protein
VAWTVPAVEGEERYFSVYDELQKLELFHSLPHRPELRAVMQALLGKTAFPHPLSVARLVFPFNEEWATPPHQDYPNNQGTEELYACWIPLTDCPQDRGSLAIAPGSHRRGLLPLRYALGAGHRQIDQDAIADLRYVGNDLDEGDLLVFHSLTVHRSLPNRTDRMRISVDYRYQREGEALVEQSLEPHFRRLDWSQIYAGWRSRRYQYYWRRLDYQLVPWDDSLHDIPETLEDAVAVRVRYDQRRRQLADRFDA